MIRRCLMEATGEDCRSDVYLKLAPGVNYLPAGVRLGRASGAGVAVALAVEAVGWPSFAGGLVASALGSGGGVDGVKGASVGSAGITGTAVALLTGDVGAVG